MKMQFVGPIAIAALLMLSALADRSFGFQNWPQFRGPQASGIADGNPPITWDLESGANIKWKTNIPGLGHSAPIVWENRIVLTTAVNSENATPSLKTGWLGGTGKAAAEKGDWTWQVICIDRADGSVTWTKDVAVGKPITKRHVKASHANCTCATDGKHIIAFFGSEGLYCLDFEGNLIWKKDFGRLHAGPYNSTDLEWGFSSSPIIHENKVIVQCDCLNTSFVSILNIETGKEIRRIPRQEVTTWSTPAIIRSGKQSQLICNGYKQMAGYDLSTGEQLWTLSGGGDIPVPTPLFADGKIILTNGHARSPTYAIDPDARGELTPDLDAERIPDGLKWWHPKDGSYMPTPIAIGPLLYTCNDNGKLTVRKLENGEQVYKRRIGPGTYSASPIGTPDRIYVSSESGDVFVFKTGIEFELLSTNHLDDPIMATPAIAGDDLLIRTSRELVCIGPDDREAK